MTSERDLKDRIGDAMPDADAALDVVAREHGDELVAATAMLEAVWCRMANSTNASATADYIRHTATRIENIAAGQPAEGH